MNNYSITLYKINNSKPIKSWKNIVSGFVFFRNTKIKWEGNYALFPLDTKYSNAVLIYFPVLNKLKNEIETKVLESTIKEKDIKINEIKNKWKIEVILKKGKLITRSETESDIFGVVLFDGKCVDIYFEDFTSMCYVYAACTKLIDSIKTKVKNLRQFNIEGSTILQTTYEEYLKGVFNEQLS